MHSQSATYQVTPELRSVPLIRVLSCPRVSTIEGFHYTVPTCTCIDTCMYMYYIHYPMQKGNLLLVLNVASGSVA